MENKILEHVGNIHDELTSVRGHLWQLSVNANLTDKDKSDLNNALASVFEAQNENKKLSKALLD